MHKGDVMSKRLNVLLAVLLLLTLTIAPAVAQRSWLELDNDLRVFGRMLVHGNTILEGTLTTLEDLIIGGDLDVTGEMNLTEDLNLTGDLVIDGVIYGGSLAVSGPTTVTTDGTVDCSDGGLHLLTAAGNVQTSLVTTTSVEGVECILLNEANVTILFTDTAALLLAGNASITQYDTLCLVSANSVWHQTCKNAN
jgi:cytoskeletal protein CcmA (bactofilin family)